MMRKGQLCKDVEGGGFQVGRTANAKALIQETAPCVPEAREWPVAGEEWLRERVQGQEARKAAPRRSQRTLWGMTQTSDLYLMATGNH